MQNNKGIVKYLKGLTEDSRMVRLFFIMVAAFVIMAVANGSKFLALSNFQSMARTFPEVGILAIAVSLAMLLGGINLSVVGIANLSGIFCCQFIIWAQEKIGMWPAIIIGLVIAMAVGAVCGLLNGFLIAYVGIPAMLATLGTQEIFIGLGVGVTKGAMSQLVSRLVKKGLLVKETAEHSASYVSLTPTKLGRKAHDNHSRAHKTMGKTIDQELFSDMSVEEMKRITQKFNRFAELLDAEMEKEGA